MLNPSRKSHIRKLLWNWVGQGYLVAVTGSTSCSFFGGGGENHIVWLLLEGLCVGVTGHKHLLYTPYISRVFYFREFCKSGSIRKFNNTRKYLPPIRPDAWMRFVYAILLLVVQCKCKTGSLILPSENEWMILISLSIALLPDREFYHSWKCLEFPIREKLDSQNIWRIQYSNYSKHLE